MALFQWLKAPYIALMVLGIALLSLPSYSRADGQNELGAVKDVNTRLYSTPRMGLSFPSEQPTHPLVILGSPAPEDYINLDLERIEALSWSPELHTLIVRLEGKKIENGSIKENVVLSPVIWRISENEKEAREQLQMLQALLVQRGQFYQWEGFYVGEKNYARVRQHMVVRTLKADVPFSGFHRGTYWVTTYWQHPCEFSNGHWEGDHSISADLPKNVVLPKNIPEFLTSLSAQEELSMPGSFYQPLKRLENPDEEL